MMTRLLASFAVVAALVVLGACERQDYKDTRAFSNPKAAHGHGAHGDDHGQKDANAPAEKH
jgi:hypothetical protein